MKKYLILFLLISNVAFSWEYLCVEDDFNRDFELIIKNSVEENSTVVWRNPSDNLTGNGYSGYWVSFNFPNKHLCFADYDFKIKIGDDVFQDEVIPFTTNDGFKVHFSIIEKSWYNKCKDGCFMEKLINVNEFKIRFSDHCGNFLEENYDVSDLESGLSNFKFPLPDKGSFSSEDTIRTCDNPNP